MAVIIQCIEFCLQADTENDASQQKDKTMMKNTSIFCW